MRWHWTDLALLLVTLLAALLLLAVIRHESRPTTPIQPVACVQVPAPNGVGLPACDGSDARGAA